jgi:hypothetical protein
MNILRSIAIALIAVGAYAQTVVTFSTAGSSTWTAPNGVTSIKVECWGGGGGGATMTSNNGGGGGGGGAYARRNAMAVTPGVIYSYTVGAAGQTNGGGNGGNTTFTGDSSVQCVANGGASVANNTSTGTAGASSGAGDTVTAGGSGASGTGSAGGGGGGSGGSSAGGNSGSGSTGATAVTGGGPGGAGKSGAQGNGSAPANGPGGGGGGGLRTSNGTRNGGNGWAGQIVITYNTMTSAVNDSLVFPVNATVSDIYTNSRNRDVSDNIQFVPSEQSRWGNNFTSTLKQLVEVAGIGNNRAVSDTVVMTPIWTGIKPAENYGAQVSDNFQFVPSEQSRWGDTVAPSLTLLADASSGVREAFFHYFASVTDNVQHVPSLMMAWGSAPFADGNVLADATNQSYTTGIPAPVVPRRTAIIK